ncbi:MAG: hypothetical protein HYX76_11700 [Acidobacteria bacterium]|nr:hypothetical protein [Acidobacteriota bacterium]
MAAAPDLTIVTDAGHAPALREIVRQLDRHGVAVSVCRAVADRHRPTLAWGLDAARVFSLRARRLGASILLNGALPTPWAALRALMTHGIDTPRSAPATTLARALSRARQIGYPVVMKGLQPRRPPALILTERALRHAWRPGIVLLQEYVWTAARVCQVAVVDETACDAVCLHAVDGFHASPESAFVREAHIDDEICRLAERTCAALSSRLAVVTIANATSAPTVIAIETNTPILRAAAVSALVDALRRPVASLGPPPRPRRPAAPLAEPGIGIGLSLHGQPRARKRLQVAITCPDERAARPVWLWHAVAQALRRDGHAIVVPRGDAAARMLDDSDFVFVDPGRTFRASGGRAGWLNLVHARARHRAHYAKRVKDGRLVSVTTKDACARMAVALSLPHPRTFLQHIPSDARFPLVMKPLAGSCGRGVRLFSAESLAGRFGPERRVPRGQVVQEWVAADVRWSVSFRIVTVRSRIVAAALFFGPPGRPSNLSLGARAIPFSGIHRSSRLTAQEECVLETLQLSARHRTLPAAVMHAVVSAAGWLSARGVQIAGHDLIPDATGGWLYLEANAYPGYLIFAETEGDRRRRLLSGYYRAATALAHEIVEEFGR